jgi:hypothetical protein
MFERSEQASPISEGVAEIRINIHLAREIIWQHDTRGSQRHHEWPRFTMTIKESSRTHLTLVHAFHVIPHRASVGGPRTISYTSVRYSRVLSNSMTVEATMFVGLHKPRMRYYIIKAWSTRPNRRGPWSAQAEATTFRTPNMKIDHSHPSHPVFSTFS